MFHFTQLLKHFFCCDLIGVFRHIMALEGQTHKIPKVFRCSTHPAQKGHRELIHFQPEFVKVKMKPTRQFQNSFPCRKFQTWRVLACFRNLDRDRATSWTGAYGSEAWGTGQCLLGQEDDWPCEPPNLESGSYEGEGQNGKASFLVNKLQKLQGFTQWRTSFGFCTFWTTKCSKQGTNARSNASTSFLEASLGSGETPVLKVSYMIFPGLGKAPVPILHRKKGAPGTRSKASLYISGAKRLIYKTCGHQYEPYPKHYKYCKWALPVPRKGCLFVHVMKPICRSSKKVCFLAFKQINRISFLWTDSFCHSLGNSECKTGKQTFVWPPLFYSLALPGFQTHLRQHPRVIGIIPKGPDLRPMTQGIDSVWVFAQLCQLSQLSSFQLSILVKSRARWPLYCSVCLGMG